VSDESARDSVSGTWTSRYDVPVTSETADAALHSSFEGQSKYEVRFDWGVDGAEAIMPGAGVVVVVDALPDSAGENDRPVQGTRSTLEAALIGRGAPILRASLRNRAAVARWILAYQERLGARAMVAIVAAGEPGSGGTTRFAVEDLLAAGALVDALAELGIDFCSPEAAAASAAFTGLSRATSHLLTASVTGRLLVAANRRDAVTDGAARDSSDEVEVL
jgi:2-phosphosulpholactate phosphatase